jgi:hypothetical protein
VRNASIPFLAWAACALAAGCRGAPAQASPVVADTRTTEKSSEVPAPAELPRAPEFEVPAGWEGLTDLAFERALDGWLPPDEKRRLTPAGLAALEHALEPGDATAVRAAVLLARTRDPLAGEVLLARLEKRFAPPAGATERDAADVVAAAAFAQGTSARDPGARLAGLAVGRRPHPDLGVRVECARSALQLGRDQVIPYLLQVLRVGTAAGRALPGAERVDDLAWAQVRASEALSARAGTPCRFRPEASVREREEEAARLEALLPSAPKKP